MKKLGVGFLGCGPVAQAIHIPYVSNFPNELRIAFFMDVADDLAQELALEYGASWSSSEDELINDPGVDVIVIGSPNEHHARQIIKSCKAGKKVVLAEKPLTTTWAELNEIKKAALKSGTTIIVGTMHAYDESYLRALADWRSLNTQLTAIEVNCYLPLNDEMVNYATQLLKSALVPLEAPKVASLESLLHRGILGLAMHDIPSVRDFLPEPLQISRIQNLTPWGYVFEGVSEGVLVRFVCQMQGEWEADWSMTVHAENATLDIQLQPSYIDAGSARVTIVQDCQSQTYQNTNSAYLSEWKEIINVIKGRKKPLYGIERISSDMEYALSIIDQITDVQKRGQTK